MIEDPDRWAPAYVEAGAGSVTFHVEAAAAPVRLARELRAQGARAGMALQPATPVEPYEDLLGELDMLLLMTVEPGSAGRSSSTCACRRSAGPGELSTARAGPVAAGGRRCLRGDDRALRGGGADMFVAGSAVFGADDPRPWSTACAARPRGRQADPRRCDG